MQRLTNEQLADMAMVVNRVTRDVMKKLIEEMGMTKEDDYRMVVIASMCASQAVANALSYLYEVEDNGAPNLGFSDKAPKQ